MSNQEDINYQQQSSHITGNPVLAERTVGCQIQSGDRLYYQGELEQALVHYRQAIELDSNSAQAHQKIAMALQKQGNLPEAMMHYRKAIVLNQAQESFTPKEKKLSVELHSDARDTSKHTQIAQSSSMNLALPVMDKNFSHENSNQSAIVPAETVIPDLKIEAAEIYLQQAIAYYEAKKWSEAIDACQNAVKASPDLAEAYKLWGNILQKLGQPLEAMGYYAKALEIKPDMAEVYANLGSLYAQQKKWDKAEQYYRKAILLKPDFSGAYRNLAKMLKQSGELEKAQECENQLFSLGSQTITVEECVRLGDRLVQEDRPEQAIHYYLQAIKLSPDLRIAYQKIAETWEQLGKWREAANYYRQMLKLEPNPSMQKLELQASKTVPALPPQSNTKLELSQARKSLQLPNISQEVTSIPERNSSVQNNSAPKDKLDLTIANYEQKAQQEPNSAPIQANLGSLYAQKQNWQKAATYYQKAIQLNPNVAGVYRNLAKVLEKLGQPEEAAKCWYQALDLEPQTANAEKYYQLGDILYKHNQLEEAINCYLRAVKLEPTKNWQTYLNLGKALSQVSRWPEAVAVYHQALAINKKNPELYLGLGNALANVEELDQAIVAYQISLQIQPTDNEASAQLAQILKKKNISSSRL